MSAATAVLRRLTFSREVVLLAVLIVLMVVMSVLSPLFLTVGNLLNTSRFFVEVGLMALGMTLIIITGGIDLSVGLFITLLDLHPLVVTLGTFALFQGLAYGLTEAQAVSDFPAWFAYFGQAYLLNIVPGQLFIFIVAVVVVWLILSRTRFGRYVYAIGNNEEAAHFSGVPVRRVKLALYSGIGLLVAVASVIYTSRVYTARGDSGLGLELDVISAVVLGGASIYGGSGTIGGTVLGVLIIATLRNGLVLAGVPSTWIVFVLGVLLLVAVFLNEFFRRREE
jgi:rhamnose transport system permease protein